MSGGSEKSDTVLYHERIPWGLMRTVTGIMAVLSVVHAGAALWIALRGPLPVYNAPLWYYSLKIFVYGGIAVLLYQFSTLEISIDADTVHVSFGRFRQHIPIDEIADCFRDTGSPLLAYGGWGVRYRYVSGAMRKVYNMPGRPVVVLGRKGYKYSEFGFSVSDPGRVMSLIADLRAGTDPVAD